MKHCYEFVDPIIVSSEAMGKLCHLAMLLERRSHATTSDIEVIRK